jgi:hypothetical protein
MSVAMRPHTLLTPDYTGFAFETVTREPPPKRSWRDVAPALGVAGVAAALILAKISVPGGAIHESLSAGLANVEERRQALLNSAVEATIGTQVAMSEEPAASEPSRDLGLSRLSGLVKNIKQKPTIGLSPSPLGEWVASLANPPDAPPKRDPGQFRVIARNVAPQDIVDPISTATTSGGERLPPLARTHRLQADRLRAIAEAVHPTPKSGGFGGVAAAAGAFTPVAGDRPAGQDGGTVVATPPQRRKGRSQQH